MNQQEHEIVKAEVYKEIALELFRLDISEKDNWCAFYNLADALIERAKKLEEKTNNVKS
jgi:hypothetical protein